MNKCIFTGRPTADPEVRYSQGENSTCVASYTIAVQREGRRVEGQPEADFIRVVAFGKTGEWVEKYIKKGVLYLVEGRIQTRSYTNKEGNKVYVTELVAQRHEFCERKNAGTSAEAAAPAPAADPAPAPAAPAPEPEIGEGFMGYDEGGFGDDEGLPFN